MQFPNPNSPFLLMISEDLETIHKKINGRSRRPTEFNNKRYHNPGIDLS